MAHHLIAMHHMKDTCNILCIEGIPGSGKTTLAENLQKRCEDSNISSFWVVEEDKKHPVTPAELRKQSGAPDFGERCILSWSSFTRNLDQVAILEGCAFQSTVRFMFANDIPFESIRRYTAQWEKTVVSVKVKFVLLVTFESFHFYFKRIAQTRGENWMHMVSEYISRTPYGKRKNLRGMKGMELFWSRYQDLCIDLVRRLQLPSFIAEISNGRWQGLDGKIYKWAFECGV